MRRTNGRKLQKDKRQKNDRPDLVLIPVYPGQPVAQMQIVSQPQLLTTTVTTGVVAISRAYDPTAEVTGWSTRFQSLWKEYRVVKVEACIELFSSTNSGMLSTWIGTTSGVPASTDALDSKAIRFNASAVNMKHKILWVPSDPGDLNYKLTSASSTPAYFKLYTDTGNFGSPAAVTQLGLVSYLYWLQFREYV